MWSDSTNYIHLKPTHAAITYTHTTLTAYLGFWHGAAMWQPWGRQRKKQLGEQVSCNQDFIGVYRWGFMGKSTFRVRDAVWGQIRIDENYYFMVGVHGEKMRNRLRGIYYVKLNSIGM